MERKDHPLYRAIHTVKQRYSSLIKTYRLILGQPAILKYYNRKLDQLTEETLKYQGLLHNLQVEKQNIVTILEAERGNKIYQAHVPDTLLLVTIEDRSASRTFSRIYMPSYSHQPLGRTHFEYTAKDQVWKLKECRIDPYFRDLKLGTVLMQTTLQGGRCLPYSTIRGEWVIPFSEIEKCKHFVQKFGFTTKVTGAFIEIHKMPDKEQSYYPYNS